MDQNMTNYHESLYQDQYGNHKPMVVFASFSETHYRDYPGAKVRIEKHQRQDRKKITAYN